VTNPVVFSDCVVRFPREPGVDVENIPVAVGVNNVDVVSLDSIEELDVEVVSNVIVSPDSVDDVRRAAATDVLDISESTPKHKRCQNPYENGGAFDTVTKKPQS